MNDILFPQFPFYGPQFLENYTPDNLENLRNNFPLRYKLAVDSNFAMEWKDLMNNEARNVVEHLEDVARRQDAAIIEQNLGGYKYIG